MFTYEDMDAVFHALAHHIRRDILDYLRLNPGASVGELASQFDVTRIAVMNHINVLEKAGLIISEKQGRSRHLHLNAAPIQMIYDRWIDSFSGYWARQLTSIKYAAEAEERKKNSGER